MKFKSALESVGWLGNFGYQVVINDEARKEAEKVRSDETETEPIESEASSPDDGRKPSLEC